MKEREGGRRERGRHVEGRREGRREANKTFPSEESWSTSQHSTCKG